MEVYYDENEVKVVRSTKQDAEYIAKHMRKADIEEIWASHHYTPEEAMAFTIEKTMFCLTVSVEGVPVVMFGVNGESILGDRGIVWMLATDDIQKIAFRFVRHSKKFINLMQEFYPYMYNYVDSRNSTSIFWLKMIGAKIQDAQPHGVEGKLFHYFYFSKES
jgi:hypothetical protein